jgi:hypothetical protein
MISLTDGVARLSAFALAAVEADKKEGTLGSAMLLRDVSIALHAMNDAVPNARPNELTGALDRRQEGGNVCISKKLVRLLTAPGGVPASLSTCRLRTPGAGSESLSVPLQCPNPGGRCPGPGFNIVPEGSPGAGTLVIECYHAKTVSSNPVAPPLARSGARRPCCSHCGGGLA